jgi:hypothetical protein
MAMVVNQAAYVSGRPEFSVSARELGKFLDRIPFRYPRFPAWFPGPGGATHPIAAFAGLRNYLQTLDSAWRPVLCQHQTVGDLEESIMNGFPTLIYGVGLTGIPHVVVPIGKTDAGWLILDPGYPTNRNPISWNSDQLAGWWRNFSFIYRRGTMIVLKPSQPGPGTTI